MAIGLPVKANYAAGDILTATNMNDLSGTFNNVATSYGNAAGKNKIINGDFTINQRGFTTASGNVYTFDRWYGALLGDGTATWTPQTFTTGSAPVAGYEASNFIRIVTSGQTTTNTFTDIRQPIENVRVFAGQTATFSFWAKAATGTPKIALEITQNFGSGGSPSSSVNTYGGQVTLSTSWARYSLTVAVPSISGKTIGTTANTSYLHVKLIVSAGSDWNARTGSLGIQSNTFDVWGVQAEAGSIATPFQTASGGSIQSELAMCQRYYQNVFNGSGKFTTTTNAAITGLFPVQMRTAPTLGATVSGTVDEVGVASRTISAVGGSGFNTSGGYISFTTATATNGAIAGTWSNTVQLSAEL